MTFDQAAVFATLGGALLLFLNGSLRYDLVAVLALLALVLLGPVTAGDAFSGFAHPAVITVAAVLVLSRALQNSGVVDVLARILARSGSSPATQVPLLCSTVAVLSGFMNNVGALALLMPVAIRISQRSGNPPGSLLMPLAFASLLGGLVTLIGTPPNLIVSTFREEETGHAFRMFDFAPVGLGLAGSGVLFISLVGWRVLPRRPTSGAGGFEITDYMTELRVLQGSDIVGKRLFDLEALGGPQFAVLSLSRGDGLKINPSGYEMILPEDILIVKSDSESLGTLVAEHGLELVGSDKIDGAEGGLGEMGLAEAVVGFSSIMVGRTAATLRLRRAFGVNLLAVAREGRPFYERLHRIRFRSGDVVLLQGPSDGLQGAMSRLGCLPLMERGLRLGQPRRVLLATLIFGTAVVASAVGLVAVPIALVAAATSMVLLNLMSLNEVYDSIDWPVIVLLAALIPVAHAMRSSGAAELVAGRAVDMVSGSPTWVAVLIVLAVTMFLSDVVNNAASALVMSPIALSVSSRLDVSPDMFLMAVAIGASSAFLTPIGHQSNTLVMGPGGYRFGDYARMGMPVEAIIVLLGVPLLLLVW